MRKTMSLLLGAALAVIGASAMAGETVATNKKSADSCADYYVAVNGNDSNPGTIALPFATIEKARLAVQSRIATGMTKDITVMLRGGTYYISNTLAFTAADSGVGGHRVVYRNYPDEVPVIDGGVPITGWTETTSGSGISSLLRPVRRAGSSSRRCPSTSRTSARWWTASPPACGSRLVPTAARFASRFAAARIFMSFGVPARAE